MPAKKKFRWKTIRFGIEKVGLSPIGYRTARQKRWNPSKKRYEYRTIRTG